jgi:transposase
VAALRHSGITAPFVLDGSMTGEIFLAYVEQFLAPTLMRKDIVILDNLSAHKAPGIREAIEAVGATLRYLPQYRRLGRSLPFLEALFGLRQLHDVGGGHP